MIPAKKNNELSETQNSSNELFLARIILEKFERAKILEVYFARLDGRTLDNNIPGEYYELYDMELETIKSFLLGQHPQDPLLQRIFMIMN